MARVKTGTVGEMVASIPDNDPMRNPPVQFATMRDLFAAHALGGVVARTGAGQLETVASLAYAYADAMLAERSKPKG